MTDPGYRVYALRHAMRGAMSTSSAAIRMMRPCPWMFSSGLR